MVQTSTIVAATVGTAAVGFIGMAFYILSDYNAKAK